jgi:hypothetical protein
MEFGRGSELCGAKEESVAIMVRSSVIGCRVEIARKKLAGCEHPDD